MPFNWVSLCLFCLRFCIARRQFAAGERSAKEAQADEARMFREKREENVVSFSMRNNVWVKMQTRTVVLIDVAWKSGKSDENKRQMRSANKKAWEEAEWNSNGYQLKN